MAVPPLLFSTLATAIEASFSSASNSPCVMASSSWLLVMVNPEDVEEAQDGATLGILIGTLAGAFDWPRGAWLPCEPAFVFNCTFRSQPGKRPSCSDFFALFCSDLVQWLICVHCKAKIWPTLILLRRHQQLFSSWYYGRCQEWAWVVALNWLLLSAHLIQSSRFSVRNGQLFALSLTSFFLEGFNNGFDNGFNNGV